MELKNDLNAHLGLDR